MLKQTSVFSVVFILFSSTVFANFKLLPGYYLDKNGDSVLCKIEYGDWGKNPSTIAVQLNGEQKILGTSDILGFGVFGYNNYKTSTVSIHTNPINSPDLPDEFSDNVKTMTCFVKVIVYSSYSLYELMLSQRAYYFLQGKDNEMNELIYRVKEVDMHVLEDRQYCRQLSALFEKEGFGDKYKYLINATFYSSTAITKLVNILNGQLPKENAANKKSMGKPFQIEVFAGGVFHNFPSEFLGVFQSFKFHPAISPTAGASFLYVLPFSFQSIAIGLSVGYNRYNLSTYNSGIINAYSSANYNSTTYYSEQVYTSNTFLMTNLFAKYYFNSLNKIKYYAKAGIAVNMSLSKDNDIYSNFSDSSNGFANGLPVTSANKGSRQIMSIASKMANFDIAFGASIKRHSLEFVYYTPKNMSLGNYIGNESTFKVQLLGLYYYYSIFR